MHPMNTHILIIRATALVDFMVDEPLISSVYDLCRYITYPF